MSNAKLSRIETGRLRSLTLVDAVMVADAVGLDLSCKTYPGRPPTRDAGHARKLGELLAHVRPPLRYSLEVALPSRSDGMEQRAWDAMLFAADGETGIELEMRLYDVQAQLRRLFLKRRDARVDRVLLLIADTNTNRRVLREFPEYFRELPRLRTATVLNQLERGVRPPSGLMLL